MAWSTPMTWSTGQIVTAAQMNEQIRDNEDYLKARIDSVSSSQPVYALDTIYRNTSSSIRFVTITVVASVDGVNSVSLKIGSTSPPVTLVGILGVSVSEGGNTVDNFYCGTIVVPPDFYYTAVGGGASLQKWAEWDILFPA